MSKASESIEKVCRNFDRDSAEWVRVWLTSFFDVNGIHKTLQTHALIHSDFGFNPTYRKYKEFLQPLCAHAIESYAEGLEFTMADATREAGAMGMMQVIEPVVKLAKLTGVPSIRPLLIGMMADAEVGK